MDKNFVIVTLENVKGESKNQLKELMDKKDKLDRFLSDPAYEGLYALHERANDERADAEVELFFMDIALELIPVIANIGIPTNDGAMRQVDEVKYREKVERAIMRYYQEKYKR